jgi:hypothetical protein
VANCLIYDTTGSCYFSALLLQLEVETWLFIYIPMTSPCIWKFSSFGNKWKDFIDHFIYIYIYMHKHFGFYVTDSNSTWSDRFQQYLICCIYTKPCQGYDHAV